MSLDVGLSRPLVFTCWCALSRRTMATIMRCEIQTFTNRSGSVLVGVVSLLVLAAVRTRSCGPIGPAWYAISTLPQAEPRTPIPSVGWNGTFPIVISQPGSCFLTRGLNDNDDLNVGTEMVAAGRKSDAPGGVAECDDRGLHSAAPFKKGRTMCAS